MNLSRRTFLFLLVAGIVVRLVLITTTIGTNDIVNWIAFATFVGESGIGPAYARSADLNHPPFSLFLLLLIERIRPFTGLEVGDLLRLMQTLFDLLAVAALLQIGWRIAPSSAYSLALFYFLSPVTIFVSAFHGNTDPAMVALLLASLALLIREPARPLLAGGVFAAAVGIKIVPLLLLPLVLIWRRDRIRFALGFVAGAAVLFVPALITGGSIVVQRIFGYNTNGGNYGVAHVLLTMSSITADPETRALLVAGAREWMAVARYVVAGAVGAYTLALAFRRERSDWTLLGGCGTAILIALTLTPGIGLQYFVWPIAFLPFALSDVMRWTLVAIFALTQFTVYTVWSGGFPWWYADSWAPLQEGINLIWFADGVWLSALAFTAAAVIRTLRRLPTQPALT